MSAPLAAVVLGLSPTGLAVVRELGRAGVRVMGAGARAEAGAASRYLSARTIVEPDADRRVARILAANRDEPGPRVLIPTSDADIELIQKDAVVLSPRFAFQESYRDGTARALMTKSELHALCRRHGVAAPRTWETTRANLPALTPQLSFPCLVKPSRIHEIKHAMRGRKVWLARDAAQLVKVEPLVPHDAPLLAQEIIPGPESEITLYAAYFDRDGEPRQAFTGRKLRQYPPGFGSASLVVSHAEPETRAIAEHFLRAIAYRGVAAAEFKRDPRDGELKIIEINPRPSLWFSLTAASGRRIALAAWRDLTGLPPLPEEPQKDGVRWRYGLKDAWSAAFYRLSPDFVLPPPDLRAGGRFTAGAHAVWNSDDPLPILADLRNTAEKGLLRIFARAGRR